MPLIAEGDESLQGSELGEFLGDAGFVLDEGMVTGVEEADFLLGDVVAGHAHKKHLSFMNLRVRDDNPEVAVDGLVLE
jgi:hypothetical protein